MKTALIFVDHGSRFQAANVMLEEVVRMAREHGGYDLVEAAHMELAEPTLEQAFERCVAQGAERVVVHPYFLSPGRHSQSDIPRMTREAGAKYPHVETWMTEPLGVDDRLIEVVLSRVEECLRRSAPLTSPALPAASKTEAAVR